MEYQKPKIISLNAPVNGWPICSGGSGGSTEGAACSPGAGDTTACVSGTAGNPLGQAACGSGKGYMSCNSGSGATDVMGYDYCSPGDSGFGCTNGYGEASCNGGMSPDQNCIGGFQPGGAGRCAPGGGGCIIG